MNKNRLVQLIYVGLIFILAACQGMGQSGSGVLFRPGDSLGGMQLATGAADAPPLWAFCSGAPGIGPIRTYNCTTPELSSLAIGHISLLAGEALTTVDWSDLAWEFSINDQAVDLESFGTFEYLMPAITNSPSPIRHVFTKGTAWDIVLTNLQPGKHTLRFLAQTDTESYSLLVNLTIEPANGTDISSVPFQLKS